MDFYDVLKGRRSIRAYKPDPVDRDKLKRILSAARAAPSAANRQPWLLVVVEKEKTKRALREAYSQEWFYTAPLIICACARPKKAWKRRDGKNYADVDTTIAMHQLILAATAEGLGTCWVGAFRAEAVSRILGLPSSVEPVAMTPLGYPAEKPSKMPRKKLRELVRFIR